MKRANVGVVLLAVLLAATGCGSKHPTTAPPTTAKTSGGAASPTTTVTGSAPASPGETPADQFEFSVDGAGPYKLGMTLTALQAAPGLSATATSTTCPGSTTAHGKGVWSDVELSFHTSDGKLYLAVNKSINVPTPSGVYLGTTLADVKKIYVGVGGQDMTHGADSAYLVVTLSGGGILFLLDSTKRVTSMIAGDSGLLRTSFSGGTGYC